MSVITLAEPKADAKLITADEFFDFVHRPENLHRHFELDEGVIIEMPPPFKFHGFVCGNVGYTLSNFGRRRKKGYVCTNDSGMILGRDPDTVRGADVEFYEDTQTADDMDRRYTEQLPVLSIEVMPPNDRPGQLNRRIRQMLDAGIPLVWKGDPENRTVTVSRPGRDEYILGENETITGEDVLPDFSCKVSEFFDLPK